MKFDRSTKIIVFGVTALVLILGFFAWRYAGTLRHLFSRASAPAWDSEDCLYARNDIRTSSTINKTSATIVIPGYGACADTQFPLSILAYDLGNVDANGNVTGNGGLVIPFAGQIGLGAVDGGLYGAGTHSLSLNVSLPCYWQTDLILGSYSSPISFPDNTPPDSEPHKWVVAHDVKSYGAGAPRCGVDLVCASIPPVTSVAAGVAATFTAAGGGGTQTLTWSAPDGNPPTGTGENFTTTWPASVIPAGQTSVTRTVTVTNGSKSSSCTVTVTKGPPPTIACAPKNHAPIAVGEAITFTATGTGPFIWASELESFDGPSYRVVFTSPGSKTVTVTSGAAQDSCTVTVTGTPPSGLTCAPASQNTLVNQNVSFTASGASAGQSYNWSAPDGGNPASGSGSTFSTKYPTIGTKIVTVTVSGSGTTIGLPPGTSAACTVVVTDIPVTGVDVACSPASQSVAINVNAAFTADHGDGTFAWTGGETPPTGSGASFTTKFSTAGNKIVTVSSAGKQATCAVTVTGLPTPQADLSLTKVAGNPKPDINSEFTYSLVLSNAGPNTATGVVVHDLLPTGVSFVKAEASQGTYDSTTGDWTLGSVTVASPPSLIIHATVPAASTCHFVNIAEVIASGQPDPDSTPNNHVATEDDQASAAIDAQGAGCTPCTSNCGGNTIDVAITKTETDSAPFEEDSVTYTMVVTNNGPLDATGVSVSDTIPDKLTFVSAQATVGEYEHSDGVWTIGDLANGAGATLVVTVTVNSGTAGMNIVNTATVSQTQTDSNPANNTASVTLTPRIQTGCTSNCGGGGGGSSSADLSLTKVVTNTTPLLGQTVSYVITVVNSGPNSTSGVKVDDVLPTGVTYVSASATQGSYDQPSGVWTIGSLDKGDHATLTIAVTANMLGTIVNTAEVTASSRHDRDSTPNNHVPTEDDQDSATMVVKSSVGGLGADLSLTKSVNDSSPLVGQHIIYTITVINSGPVPATGVSVKDVIPSQLKFSSVNVSQGSFDSGGGVWSVGNLAVGNSATIQLSVVVRSAGNITNVAEVRTSDQPDPDSIPNNNNPAEDDQASVLVKSRGKPILPAASSAGTLPVLFGFGAISMAAAVRFRRRSFGTQRARSGAVVISSYDRYD